MGSIACLLSPVHCAQTQVAKSTLGGLFSALTNWVLASVGWLLHGAGAVLLCSESALKRYNLTPIGKFLGFSVAGVPPEIMGIGPIRAIPKVLAATGVRQDDLDWIELNEAFAAQSLAVLKGLELDPEGPRLNANGGAIALGHPLGCTGAKLTATLLAEMTRRKTRYGMVTMCVGGGMGAAGIFERIEF